MQDIKLILKDIEVRKANDFWILKKQNELEQRWYILLIKEWRKAWRKKLVIVQKSIFIWLICRNRIDFNPVLASTIDHGIPIYQTEPFLIM
jgi:hypothetical protein